MERKSVISIVIKSLIALGLVATTCLITYFATVSSVKKSFDRGEEVPEIMQIHDYAPDTLTYKGKTYQLDKTVPYVEKERLKDFEGYIVDSRDYEMITNLFPNDAKKYNFLVDDHYESSRKLTPFYLLDDLTIEEGFATFDIYGPGSYCYLAAD